MYLNTLNEVFPGNALCFYMTVVHDCFFLLYHKATHTLSYWIFYLLQCTPICIRLTFSIPVISKYFQEEWKTVWILIRWLPQKPSDLDLHCFQNKINPGTAGQRITRSVYSHGNPVWVMKCILIFDWKEAKDNLITCQMKDSLKVPSQENIHITEKRFPDKRFKNTCNISQ